MKAVCLQDGRKKHLREELRIRREGKKNRIGGRAGRQQEKEEGKEREERKDGEERGWWYQSVVR